MSEPCRILVVDDHPIVRQGLATLLAAAPDLQVVATAATIEEALAALAEARPEVAVVDLTLKDRSGLELIAELRKSHPHIKSLVLSMHDEEDYAERALQAGASGYVMKEKADEVIVEALRRVRAGEVYLSPEVSSRMLRAFAGQAGGERTGLAALSEREREVFLLMGRGWATKRIADHFSLSTRTVEVHRAHIKRKLQCDDLAQLLREAIRYAEANPL
jgi:DNA-binding NarL/FixJ family response regulator